MVKEFEMHSINMYLAKKYGTYDRFVESEGLPILTGSYVRDVRTVPLKPWKRRGGYGAYLNFSDQRATDAYIAEIPKGKSLKPQKHLFEEIVIVAEGSGASTVWYEGQRKHTFEWQKHSVFAIPLNSWHQHFASGDGPARLFAVTTAPFVMEMFTNTDFVFDNPWVFQERMPGEEEYYKRPAKYFKEFYGGILDTNFIPDIKEIDVVPREARGIGNRNMYITLAGSTQGCHVSKYPVGVYKKAHRHGPGAHIFQLTSHGYTLMWLEGQKPQRYGWQEGSVVSPPAGCYHQNFNTGKEPAMFLAFHGSHAGRAGEWDDRQLLNYEDEDPIIREMYEKDLKKNGVVSAMPSVKKSRK